MAGTETGGAAAGTEESGNSLLAPLSAKEFQGFATKDGEPLIETPPGTKAPKVGAKAGAKPVKAAEEELEGDEGEAEVETAAKPDKSAQARINKAVAKQRGAERARDAAEARANATEQRLARIEGQFALLTSGNTTPKKDPNAPDAASYKAGDIDPQYIADLARYEARKTATETSEASAKAAKSTTDRAAAAAFKAKVDDFSDAGTEKYDDFHDVVFDEDFHLSGILGELGMESDHGPEILYTLAGDKKEAKRVLGLSPARQAAWFGAREVELSSESSGAGEEDGQGEESGTSQRTTQAPQPLSKTRSNGGVPRTNSATSDFASFERMANASLKTR